MTREQLARLMDRHLDAFAREARAAGADFILIAKDRAGDALISASSIDDENEKRALLKRMIETDPTNVQMTPSLIALPGGRR
jgi:hypothetical protein